MKLQNDPIADLALAAQYLTSESYSLSAGLDSTKAHLQSVLSGLGAMLTNSKAQESLDTPVQDLSGQERAFIKLVNVVPYTTWKEYQATVPAGFTGKYIEYLEILKSESLALGQFSQSVLTPYVRFLALVLSDADAAKSTRAVGDFKKAQARRDRANTAIGKLFGRGHEVNVKAGVIVDRTADWAEVFKLRKAAQDALNAQKTSEVSAHIKQAEDYLTLIVEQIDQNKLLLSSEVRAQIADQAYQIAREAEHLSSIRYRMEVLNAALAATHARFETILG